MQDLSKLSGMVAVSPLNDAGVVYNIFDTSERGIDEIAAYIFTAYADDAFILRGDGGVTAVIHRTGNGL